MRFLTALVLVSLLSPVAHATDYFACDCQAGSQSGCTPGNDASSGTSPAAPWRSFDRLFSASAGSRCGDTFNLCSGGVFSTGGGPHDFAIAADCSADPRVLRSYDPGGFTQRPRVETSAADTMMNLGGFSSGPGALGFTLRGVELRQRVPSQASRGIYINRAGRNISMDDVVIDGFNVCLEMAASVGPSQFSVSNSTFRNCSAQGIIGTAAPGSSFIGNTIEDSACRIDPTSCGFQHSIYLSTSTSTTGFVFRNNTVRRSNRVAGACTGNPVTIRGANGLVFEGNVFDMRDAGGTRNVSTPCYAVRFNQNSGDLDVEGCLNCTIRGNSILEADIAMDVVGARNTVIENNRILMSDQTTGGWCLALNLADGGPPFGGPEDQTANAVTARNNSIFLDRPNLGCTGIRFGLSQGTGHGAYSNAVQIVRAATSAHCYEYQDATRVQEDNNLCGLGSAGTYANLGGTPRTLLQTRQQLGGCPAAGNACASQEANPAFASPAAPAYDLSLASGSAARDAGHPQLSSPIDFDGVQRPIGPGFDAGAYEYGGSALPAAPDAPILLTD